MKQCVFEDLYFDYAPDEIQVSFRKQTANRVLVRLQDRQR